MVTTVPTVSSPLGPPDEERHWIDKAIELAGRFAQTAAEHDASSTIPVDNLRLLFQEGFDTALLSHAAGEAGMSYRTWGRVVGHIARACPSTACIWVMHSGVAVALILLGEPEMAEYYTAELRAGKRFANALSEPSSGNMFLVPMQHAVSVPGGWRLDGAKRFVSGCEIADHLLVNALVEGIPTFFGVEPDETVKIIDIWDAMGIRGSRSQLISFEGTLLREDRKCKPLATVQDPNPVSLGLPWLSIGVAEAAFEALRQHALKRIVPAIGKPLAHMQWVQYAVADAAVRLKAATLLAERGLWLADMKSPEALAATIEAKLMANEVAKETASLALSVAGGSGYLKSSPIERHFRDAQAGALMAYSVELCRDFVGKQAFGIDVGVTFEE